MKWIDEIREVYHKYFKDSLDELGFSNYQEVEGPGMGALIKFRNNSFLIRLINDKGIIESELSSLLGEEQFRSVEMFSSLLRFQQLGDKVSRQERRRVLGTKLGYSGQCDFIIENHIMLAKLLDVENYQETLRRIDEMMLERWGF